MKWFLSVFMGTGQSCWSTETRSVIAWLYCIPSVVLRHFSVGLITALCTATYPASCSMSTSQKNHLYRGSSLFWSSLLWSRIGRPKRRSQIPLNLTLTIALTILTLMVTVSGNPNPNYPINPTTKYRCELDMCCLTWYKNFGPPFTGMPQNPLRSTEE